MRTQSVNSARDIVFAVYDNSQYTRRIRKMSIKYIRNSEDYSAHSPTGLFSDRSHQVLRLLVLPT